MSRVHELINELKQHEWVELSHELYNDTIRGGVFKDEWIDLNRTAIDWGDFAPIEFKVQVHTMVGQFGTHIDAPGHFHKDMEEDGTIGKYGINDLLLPMVVIDLTDKVAENEDYAIQISDVLEHEAKYGRIEEGSFVAIRTDWAKRWDDPEKFFNEDADGQQHFPGWAIEAMQFLVEERGVIATGHETLDPDAALEIAKHGDYLCERYILGTGSYQIEGLNNLDKVPATGASILITFPRIMEANGSPVRAWAILP